MNAAADEVPMMLTKAGARMAWLLNRALDSGSAKSETPGIKK